MSGLQGQEESCGWSVVKPSIAAAACASKGSEIARRRWWTRCLGSPHWTLVGNRPWRGGREFEAGQKCLQDDLRAVKGSRRYLSTLEEIHVRHLFPRHRNWSIVWCCQRDKLWLKQLWWTQFWASLLDPLGDQVCTSVSYLRFKHFWCVQNATHMRDIEVLSKVVWHPTIRPVQSKAGNWNCQTAHPMVPPWKAGIGSP